MKAGRWLSRLWPGSAEQCAAYRAALVELNQDTHSRRPVAHDDPRYQELNTRAWEAGRPLGVFQAWVQLQLAMTDADRAEHGRPPLTRFRGQPGRAPRSQPGR
jgi:hypothetical protein